MLSPLCLAGRAAGPGARYGHRASIHKTRPLGYAIPEPVAVVDCSESELLESAGSGVSGLEVVAGDPQVNGLTR